MIKNLLEKLIKKIENESDCDKKTKNGISIYFVEKILEEKYGKPNYINSRTIKGYFDKYVFGKENNSGEPNFELKNLISQYLGYKDYFDFENNNFSERIKEGGKSEQNKNVKWFIFGFLIIILIFSFYYNGLFRGDGCIVWKVDHYEKIDCENEFSEPILEDLNFEKFKKLKVSDTTTFFIKGQPIVWYGKSKSGEHEYFNSRGVHPTSKKELKPITEHIINKYIYNNK